MRIGTYSTFARVLFGLRANQSAAIRAQEQLASGLRILRPSDDPAGAERVIQLQRSLADMQRFHAAIGAGRTAVDSAASSLLDAASLMSEARALVLQGMNGTLAQQDRTTLAGEFDRIRSELLELGNRRVTGRYLFSGTATGTSPWEEVVVGGRRRIVYRGNEESGVVRAGEDVEVPILLPGSQAFGRFEPSGTSFDGLTGVASGSTADEGTGWTTLALRHDSTDPGALAAVGIALVNGGANDTLLGSNALSIDPVAGTIQLGSGPVLTLPSSTDPAYADFVVENELGGTLHLDFSGYNGIAFTGAVVGNGSASLDGSTYVPLSFTETDLELSDPAAGTVLHVDTTSVKRAGNELVTFGGTTNVFDLMEGIAEDLRNPDGLEAGELLTRLEGRLLELDRHAENLRMSVGVLGSRSQRLQVSDTRASDLEVQLGEILSRVRDADLAAVAIDLARAEQLLQVAQASGARLIQTSLLNYLG